MKTGRKVFRFVFLYSSTLQIPRDTWEGMEGKTATSSSPRTRKSSFWDGKIKALVQLEIRCFISSARVSFRQS